MTNKLETRHYRRYFNDIRFIYQKKQIRYYTGIVLSILTVNFFLFFAVRPTLVTIASLWKEIKNEKVIAQKLEDKIDSLNQAQTEYQKVEKDLGIIYEAMPETPNSPDLIRQLEALAINNGVTIVAFQLGSNTLKGKQITVQTLESSGVNPADLTSGLDFNIIISGEFDQLKSFVNDLNNLRRLITINNFSFQVGQENELGKLALSFNAKAPYLKDTSIINPLATGDNSHE